MVAGKIVGGLAKDGTGYSSKALVFSGDECAIFYEKELEFIIFISYRKGLIMINDSSYYEEEYLDSDERGFQKLSRKTRLAKQDKKAPIKAKRKEKLRQQLEESSKTFSLIC